MPLKGPPPTPTALKLLKGNPGRRPLNADEPVTPPLAVVPTPPTHVGRAGKAAWEVLAPLLTTLGVLTAVDLLGFERLCVCYGDVRRIEQLLARQGRYQRVKTKAGGYMRRLHPAVSELQEADRRLRMYLAEFGALPASRSRVRVGKVRPGAATDPAERYFA